MLDFCQEYIDIIKSLESSNDIEKVFSTINEAFLLNQIPQNIFEKAQKVYKDNAENRKLKRVGKPWGKNGGEEGKQEPSKSEEKPLEQHAKEASQGDLERTIKESGDEKLRQAAHAELERRQKEEAPQEEEKKTEEKKETGKEEKDIDHLKQQEEFAETERNEILKFLKKYNIEIEGNINTSNTGYGTSHYFYVKDGNSGDKTKVRISDHEASNKVRVENEYMINGISDDSFKRLEYFTNPERFELKEIKDRKPKVGDVLKNGKFYEKVKKEEKKELPSGENPEADTKKEPDTAGKDSGSGGVSERKEGDGSVENPFILNKDKIFHDWIFGNPNAENIKKTKEFNKWLKDNKDKYIELYHGTNAKFNIMNEGLNPTTNKTKRSYQSQTGYVYLSMYPDMAKTFADMGYPQEETKVYKTTLKISDLLADKDQLKNKRLWGGYNNLGDSLAESFIAGSGARVKRKIFPYEIKEFSEPKDIKKSEDCNEDEIEDKLEK